MRRFALLWILFLAVFVFSKMGNASSQTAGLMVFAGAGNNFIFPSTFRIGWGNWEAGLLSPGFIGANKLFATSGSAIYSSLGFGFNSDGDPSNIGFQAGAGFSTQLFWQIRLRGEMFALANLNGKFMSHGLLGISYGF